jgi:hypothetical protein
MEDSDLSCSVEDYASVDDYAVAMAVLAAGEDSFDVIGVAAFDIIGADPASTDCEFGVETERGAPVRRERIVELRDAINELPNYRAGSHIMARSVRYGPWRAVPAGAISAFLEDEAAADGDGAVP